MARLRRSRAAVNGFLNIHKPAGVTSHHCVAVVRKIFNTTEVGHAGTLDPMATGVLVVAVGRATKFLQHLVSDKEYRGVIRFGMTTDTDDITGEVLTRRPVPWITEQLVRSKLQSFVGSIDQIPPRISALKRDGKRLYEMARENQKFDVQARRVQIHGIDMLKFAEGDFPEATVHVACGAGTYIRSIARECGEAIEVPGPRGDEHVRGTNAVTDNLGSGCAGGTLVTLERTRSGTFMIDQSIMFEQIRGLLEDGATPLHSVEAAVKHLPLISLSSSSVDYWYKGGEVQVSPDCIFQTFDSSDPTSLPKSNHVRIYDRSEKFLGVSHVDIVQPKGLFILRRRSFIVSPF